MKYQLRLLASIVVAAVAIVATVFSAFASEPGLARKGEFRASADSASAAACTSMQAGDVVWVTLNEDGEIEEEVESYESGVTLITPVFQYNCVPKNTTIVTVFSLNGEQVYSDKETLKASTSKGIYGYPLGTEDDSPMDDGDWAVEFYNNKTLLSQGEVVVGEGGAGPSETVTVQGTVLDKKTKKPIKGAVFLVLKPGVTVQKFIKGGQKDADVFTGGQTDAKGQFVLKSPLVRNVEYSVIVAAKGYKPIGKDGFLISDDDPDPLRVDVTLTK